MRPAPVGSDLGETPQSAPRADEKRVRLRPVIGSDLPVFFEHQLDQQATRMAAFPSRERAAFMAHWARILADETNTIRTILFDGQVAGNIVSFLQEGEREVGYWLGRQYWGKGIATQALSQFLTHVTERPLYARVATHNLASRRVLQKCGFTVFGKDKGSFAVPGDNVESFVLMLAEPPPAPKPD